MINFENVALQIETIHAYFSNYANKQVNYAYTLRNWLIGMYLYEYEQKGLDRAQYGEKLYKSLALQLKEKNVKGMSFTLLHTCRQFYLVYPQIIQSVSEQFGTTNSIVGETIQTLSEQFEIKKDKHTVKSISIENTNFFLSRISFSHLLEFIKIDDPLQRSFYEVQTIKNNWTVRQLQREINALLYERIGMSSDKESLIEKIEKDQFDTFSEVLKSPYLLEFLGIPEKASYFETDLEQGIIDHLQQFLIELRRGFCFESRQKRISFHNKHYKIDLVFYHRILKCHILIDLKLGEFDHADAGQMNVYLNYFKENEMAALDNNPIGIILCCHKDNASVHYATGGLSQEIFVSKYKFQLPSEEELRKWIENDVKYFEENQ